MQLGWPQLSQNNPSVLAVYAFASGEWGIHNVREFVYVCVYVDTEIFVTQQHELYTQIYLYLNRGVLM